MASPTVSSTSGRLAGRGKKVIWTLSASFGLVLMVVVMVVMFGRVNGEEFSPDSFARRRYSYFELPVVKMQITPIRRRDRTPGDVELHLISQKWVVNKSAKGTERWDLVVSRVNQNVAHVGDARILCRYLDAHDADQNLFWLKWSEDHPELAAVLWPAIVGSAQKQLYLFIPDLIAAAKRSETVEQLTANLDATLGNRYAHLAAAQAELGKHDLAVALYDEALAHESENVRYLESRAESLQQLGRSEAADRDRQAAQRLRSS